MTKSKKLIILLAVVMVFMLCVVSGCELIDKLFGKEVPEQPTVQNVTITVSQQTVKVYEGKTSRLTFTVKADDQVLETVPTLSVTSSNSAIAVATQSESGLVISGQKAGSAQITVSGSYSGKDFQTQIDVTVLGLTLSGEQALTQCGETTLSAKFTDGSSSAKITWTTSNSAIATVDANGKVTAVGYGEVTITATSVEGPSAKLKITVAQKFWSFTAPTGEHFAFEVLSGVASDKVAHGATVSFKVTVDEHYDDIAPVVKNGEQVLTAKSAEGRTYVYEIANVGADVSVSVSGIQANLHSIVFPQDTEGYSFAEVTGITEGKAPYGATVSFKIALAAQYGSSQPIVKVNGAELTANEGVYGFVVAQDSEITVIGIGKDVYTITMPAQEHFEFVDLSATLDDQNQCVLEDGTTVSFKISLDALYCDSTLVVKAGEQTLTAQDGVYSFVVSSATTVSVQGVQINASKSVSGLSANTFESNYTITAEGYTANDGAFSITKGQQVEFAIATDAHHSLANAVVKANGAQVQVAQGKFSITIGAEDIVFTVEGIEIVWGEVQTVEDVFDIDLSGEAPYVVYMANPAQPFNLTVKTILNGESEFGSEYFTQDGAALKFTSAQLSAICGGKTGEITLEIRFSDYSRVKATICAITKVIKSYADFTSARDGNTTDGIWNGYFVLGASFAMPDDWYDSNVTAFKGTFDGRGYAISNGHFHSGAANAKKSLFGELYGTIKNTAFTGCTFGIMGSITLNTKDGSVIDNCLFEGKVLGDYANQCAICANGISGSTVLSNCVVYLNDAAIVTAKNNSGAIGAMVGCKPSNVYVFASKATNYGHTNYVASSVKLYAYSANLPTGMTGFNDCWDLTGEKATFKAISTAKQAIANEIALSKTAFENGEEFALPTLPAEFAWKIAQSDYADKAIIANGKLTINTTASFDCTLVAYWTTNSNVKKEFALSVEYIHVISEVFDLFLDSADGSKTLALDKLGAQGEITSVKYADGSDVDYTADGGIKFGTIAAGEHQIIAVVGGVKHSFNVVAITKVISSYADFTSARDGNTTDGAWNGYFVLGASFAMPDDWYDSNVTAFKGTFDGRGYAISNGHFHSGAANAKKSLFGELYGTIKNTAFTGCTFGIMGSITLNTKDGSVIDNCLFEGKVLGDYANQCAICANGISGSTVLSNCVVYLNDAAIVTAKNNSGAIGAMVGCNPSNVYVFASKATNYGHTNYNAASVKLYAYSANLPAGMTGFNDCWDLTGEKATFKAISKSARSALQGLEAPASALNSDNTTATLPELPANCSYSLASESASFATISGNTLTATAGASCTIKVVASFNANSAINRTFTFEFTVIGAPDFANATLLVPVVDLYLNSNDQTSLGGVKLADLGLSGTVRKVYGSGMAELDSYTVTADGFTASGISAGENVLYFSLTNDPEKVYKLNVVAITKVISSYADFTSARDGNTTDGAWNGYFVLGASFAMPDDWYSSNVTSFTGTFDGRGYAISNGHFHSGGSDAKKNLFGELYGTIKNTAFTGCTFGIFGSITLNTKDGSVIDNCLFDGTVLGDYNNQCAICSNGISGNTVLSNCVVYLNDAAIVTSSKNSGAIAAMVGCNPSNVYVFASKATNYGHTNYNAASVKLYAYSANLPAGMTGFNAYWDLSGAKATMKHVAIELACAEALANATDLDNEPVILATDGSMSFDAQSIGISKAVTKIYGEDGTAIAFTSDNGIALALPQMGEQYLYVLAGELYKVKAIGANVISTVEQLQAFASASQSGYWALGANIDATGVTIKNTGTFSGVFDGLGHVISNATFLSANGNSASGMFGAIASGAVVKNFGIVNGALQAEYSWVQSSVLTGGANNSGTISNVYVEITSIKKCANEDKDCANMYGICNNNAGIIENCVIKMPSTVQHNVTNMVLNDSVIRNVIATGCVAANNNGWNQGTAITNYVSGFTPDMYNEGLNANVWTIKYGQAYMKHDPAAQSMADLTFNASNYAIMYDDAVSQAQQAATVLQTYIEKATGVKPELLKKGEYGNLNGRNYISVGYTYHFNNVKPTFDITGNGTDKLGLGGRGFVITVIGGNVYISGYTEGSKGTMGMINGAYEWLRQQFGLEIYSADEIVVAGGQNNATLKDVQAVVIPEINYVIGGNADSYGNATLGMYATNGVNGIVAGAYGEGNIPPMHNILDFLPYADYKDILVYSYDSVGYRNVYDLCLAQSQDAIIEALLPRMKAIIGNNKYISFTAPDGSFWCRHCRNEYASNNHGYATEQEYVTAIYTEFMIKLADAMSKDNQLKNVTLLMFHYGLASKLPATLNGDHYELDSGIQAYLTENSLELPSNLAVIFTYMVGNNYQGEADFSVCQDDVNRWHTITDKFFFWTYVENYTNYFAPFDGEQQIDESIKFAIANGAVIYYPQGMMAIGSKSLDWGALENYLISKLSVDSSLNKAELIADFMANYYGTAGAKMAELYDQYKAKMASLAPYGSRYEYDMANYITTAKWSKSDLEGFLNKIDEALAVLSQAKSSSEISEERYNALKARVETESLTFKYMYIKLYGSDAVARYSANNISALKTAFIAECQALGVTNFNESTALSVEAMFN